MQVQFFSALSRAILWRYLAILFISFITCSLGAQTLYNVDGVGKTGFIPKWTNDGNDSISKDSIIENSLLFDNGSSIGLGTTSPSSLFTTQRGSYINPSGYLGGFCPIGPCLGTGDIGHLITSNSGADYNAGVLTFSQGSLTTMGNLLNVGVVGASQGNGISGITDVLWNFGVVGSASGDKVEFNVGVSGTATGDDVNLDDGHANRGVSGVSSGANSVNMGVAGEAFDPDALANFAVFGEAFNNSASYSFFGKADFVGVIGYGTTDDDDIIDKGSYPILRGTVGGIETSANIPAVRGWALSTMWNIDPDSCNLDTAVGLYLLEAKAKKAQYGIYQLGEDDLNCLNANTSIGRFGPRTKLDVQKNNFFDVNTLFTAFGATADNAAVVVTNNTTSDDAFGTSSFVVNDQANAQNIGSISASVNSGSNSLSVGSFGTASGNNSFVNIGFWGSASGTSVNYGGLGEIYESGNSVSAGLQGKAFNQSGIGVNGESDFIAVLGEVTDEEALRTSADVDFAVAVLGKVNFQTDDVEKAYSFMADWNNNLPTVTVDTGIGICLDTIDATVTYGVFQQGPNDDNYFAGNVGIGTMAPTCTLEVNGTACKPGGGTWAASSDSRLKKDVKEYKDGLEVLKQIKPVTYNYNENSGYDQNKEHIGVIAQDLKEVAPYMVMPYEKNGEEYLMVDHSAFTFMLINAMQELEAEEQAYADEIEEQEAEIEELQTQVADLTDRLDKLLLKLDNTCMVSCEELEQLKITVNEQNADAIESSNGSIEDAPKLYQNVPNPFEHTTRIAYYLPEGSIGKLEILSMDQQVLNTYDLSAGNNQLILNIEELSAATYFYRLVVNGSTFKVLKMIKQ